jgi:hypothetical protein
VGKRGVYREFFQKTPKGNKLLERQKHRWEDNIKMDLREIDWRVEWVHLAYNTVT